MGLCLSCFPPDTTLENYLNAFFKTKAPLDKKSRLNASLHAILFGAPSMVGSAYDVAKTLANFNTKSTELKYLPDDLISSAGDIKIPVHQQPVSSASTGKLQQPEKEKPFPVSLPPPVPPPMKRVYT